MSFVVPCGSTTVAYLGSLYFIGGDNEMHIWGKEDDPFIGMNRVIKFDLSGPGKGCRDDAPFMFYGRFHPSVVSFNGMIYAIGGSKINFGEVFDTIRGTWTELRPPCDTFYSSYPVLLDSSRSRILVHCFWDNSLYAYNVADESWQCLNRNYGEWSWQSAVLNGVIFSLVFYVESCSTLSKMRCSLRAYDVDEKKELEIDYLSLVGASIWKNYFINLVTIGDRRLYIISDKLCIAVYDRVRSSFRYQIINVFRDSGCVRLCRVPGQAYPRKKLKVSCLKYV